MLHSYYSGLESIFVLIYKQLEGKSPSGNMWHSDLFTYMFSETEQHSQILSQDLFVPLKNYLGFRHVFRHAYGYELDWIHLKPLSDGLKENWIQVKACLESFTA